MMRNFSFCQQPSHSPIVCENANLYQRERDLTLEKVNRIEKKNKFEICDFGLSQHVKDLARFTDFIY